MYHYSATNYQLTCILDTENLPSPGPDPALPSPGPDPALLSPGGGWLSLSVSRVVAVVVCVDESCGRGGGDLGGDGGGGLVDFGGRDETVEEACVDGSDEEYLLDLKKKNIL